MCIMDDFKFLADLIQHIPLQLRARYVFCCAPISKKMPFVCAMFLKVRRIFCFMLLVLKKYSLDKGLVLYFHVSQRDTWSILLRVRM